MLKSAKNVTRYLVVLLHLFNPLTPDLNPTVQWQSPEIFYWGF